MAKYTFTDATVLIPTNQLRFALRYQDILENGISVRREMRVLQTHFRDLRDRDVWEDVPLVDLREARE